jgi:hypothetical protein
MRNRFDASALARLHSILWPYGFEMTMNRWADLVSPDESKVEAERAWTTAEGDKLTGAAAEVEYEKLAMQLVRPEKKIRQTRARREDTLRSAPEKAAALISAGKPFWEANTLPVATVRKAFGGRRSHDLERYAALLLAEIFQTGKKPTPSHRGEKRGLHKSAFDEFAAESFKATGLKYSSTAIRKAAEAWRPAANYRRGTRKLLWGQLVAHGNRKRRGRKRRGRSSHK